MTVTMSGYEFVPHHLRAYIAHQDPSLYTAIDHASWRYIMRVSKAYFAQYAHQKYLDGLIETGISTDHIPLVSEMDLCLQKFGWRAVPISGFIPPAVFLEFQSLGILPIACEMRRLENISYTPAPDIVHEAAGHAPIIADPDYAAYLKAYGEAARYAIYNHEDLELYEYIRALSDLKENPATAADEIKKYQDLIEDHSKKMALLDEQEGPSEATQISRMAWWTTEYGLVGNLDSPKIYGAGLLSSVKESYDCFNSTVKKIPFSADCINQSFDITKPQPQLYLAKNFQELKSVLDTFALTMSYKKGGLEGVKKAKRAQTLTTLVLDTGLQISGILDHYLTNSDSDLTFIKTKGPTQLSLNQQQLSGHSTETHPHGFSAPLGQPLEKINDLTDADWMKITTLHYPSGFKITGHVTQVLRHPQKNHVLLVTFESCTVTREGEESLYFKPEWGSFDLALGSTITSVFGGAADRTRYPVLQTQARIQLPKTNLTDQNKNLNQLYQKLRELREALFLQTSTDQSSIYSSSLVSFFDNLKKLSLTDTLIQNDWLIRLELYELTKSFALLTTETKDELQTSLLNELHALASEHPELKTLIHRGLQLC
jgi:phenylalanine-4-hydroxylase